MNVPDPAVAPGPVDVVRAARALVAHVAAVATRLDVPGSRVRERVVTGPSLPVDAEVDGFWAGVRIRIEVPEDGGDGDRFAAAVACLRDRDVTLAEVVDTDGRGRAEGHDTHGSEVAVDWNPAARWLAVSTRTAALPPPSGLESHLDLDEVFLDRVDPGGERFRDQV